MGTDLAGQPVGAEQRKPYLRKRRRKGLFRHTSVRQYCAPQLPWCLVMPRCAPRSTLHVLSSRTEGGSPPFFRSPARRHPLVSSRSAFLDVRFPLFVCQYTPGMAVRRWELFLRVLILPCFLQCFLLPCALADNLTNPISIFRSVRLASVD